MSSGEKKMAESWVITGGCGFIGRNLIRQLLLTGEKCIWVFDKAATESIGTIDKLVDSLPVKDINVELYADLSNNTSNQGFVRLVNIDISNRKDLERYMPNDCNLVHLAANSGVQLSITSPELDFESNVEGVFNCLDVFRRKSKFKFIFASSSAVLGEVGDVVHENLPANPITPYGVSKLYGERIGSSFSQIYGTKFVSLRFANVYGPHSGEKTSVVAKFLGNAIKGKTIIINGDGRQTRDFIYVNDLVDAIISAAQKNINNEIFQISSNTQMTIRQVADRVQELGQKILSKHVHVSFGPELQGDIRAIQCDNSKALRHLDWQPKVDFERGMQETFEWFMRNYNGT
jgi:UDP-glucose 4-epimerase